MVPRYESIEELSGTQSFQLKRGRRADTGLRVLIKTPRNHPMRAVDIEALRRESEILASLAIPGVPRTLGLAPHGQALVMEDPGGAPLNSLLAAGRPELAWSLAIAIELAGILKELHGRGTIHNALRPAAILCDAASARAWLIDLSDASGGVADIPPSPSPLPSTGRLLYVSPEQTGRINRTIDHRSDLYSLGVVLYELLTGVPPFRSNDALELIHWHIARTPVAPIDMDAGIPEPLSSIVMRLLAKAPEDRYRGALGLREDLEICLREWAAKKSIAPFRLGRHDIGDQFVVSQKLYGRQAEVATLLGAFDRMYEGHTSRPSIMLVAGYSGIGKTSLIQELYKPIMRQRGYFISGKFDQVVRNIPFGALIQAFQALVRQLLTENEARLARWRDTLAQALGANGGVLAEVIPEIELIIGKQPLSVALGPTEALNRFQMVIQNFVAALARSDHPLVVFLDDLQWADAATLRLLEPLLSSREIPCLFLIGAYRDNEVDAAHPLSRTLAALESARLEVQRVSLGPLRLADLTELVRDTLHNQAADAEPLAQLVLDKTDGNPFFAIQFMKTLKDEGYFQFDHARSEWTFRIEAIAAAPTTDNVIDMMARKIQRLSARTQRVLTLAACIGNRFDFDTLTLVSEQSSEATAQDLREAVNNGLVLPARRNDDSVQTRGSQASGLIYAFLHDRVQQSAYALIPAERRQGVLLSVGRLLRVQATPQQVEERIFDIVQHLNFGRSLITDEAERLDVARLNLSAARKAKSSTAHEAALGYLQAGLSLLGEERWNSDYDLTFSLHLETAESEYLCGQFDAADRHLTALLQRAVTNLDRARVYRLRSLQFENMSRYSDALASAREGLALFGVVFPDAADQKQIALENEIAATHSLLGGRSIASLVDLPVMTHPEIRMVMNIMTDIWASAYILGEPVLARLISATMVRLSLTFGNVEESAYGYVTHAITIGAVRGDYQSAYEFGRLALSVNQRFNDARRRAKINQQFHAHVNFWRQPMHTCIPYAREACRSGLESGDFLYAAYGAATELWSAILATQDLAQFVREYTPRVALVTKLKNTGFADSLKIILNWARALQGKTQGRLSLSDEAIDENVYVETYRGNAFFTTFHAVAKLHLCYLFGEHEKALEAARIAGEVVYQLAGTVWPLMFDFWNGLTLAANYPQATPDERTAYREELKNARRSFSVLAENCPENFLCQSLLLSAEIERIAERPLAALELYERAIGYAGEAAMLQHQGLANELCAKFRLGRGQRKIAAVFMAEARACYAQWGAVAKVKELERSYPDLLGEEIDLAPRTGSDAGAGAVQAASNTDAGALDLASVMKAAQAIVGEIELERLLAKLIRIAIENAGAERGCLILEYEGVSLLQAEGSVDAAAVAVHDGIPLAQAQNLPASVVNYVRRTSESIVLANARSDDRFGGDPYIVRHEPRSMMCVPVLKQGRLVGALYLEHNKVYGAFTPERIQLVQLLAAEAATSLENAKLFEGLRREVQERAQAEEKLRTALAEVERLKNELEAENTYLRRDLIVNVSHDLRTPLTSLRGYVETLLIKEDSLSTAERRRYLEIAARQSERLATLVDELFELAKLEFKGVQLNLEPLQVGELAHDVLQKFQLAADRKQVRLRVEALGEIPLIQADVSLLERVFDNLLGNALRHTPARGQIRVSIAPEAEHVVVRVADTGSGIPQADVPFLFDRFYRGDKARNLESGSAGLGLAIAKRILDLHEGQIAVESNSPAGACFSFSLPVRGTPKMVAA